MGLKIDIHTSKAVTKSVFFISPPWNSFLVLLAARIPVVENKCIKWQTIHYIIYCLKNLLTTIFNTEEMENRLDC